MTICIFPGTFNPIHIAHIKMAVYALNKYNFEKIVFIPSYIPPHKQIDSNLAEHRYNMVKLAVKMNPRFDISDIEYKSPQKSYTLITVNKIKEKYNIQGRVNMIIGSDAFINVNSWYKADELKNLVHFIVFPREGYEISCDMLMDFSYEIADSEKLDISSTQIRENHEGQLPKEVKDYIEQNALYN